MCYSVYLSTDSPENLADRNSALVRFDPVSDPASDPSIALLAFPNHWEVKSKSDCGCTFRHLHTSSVNLGFSEPVDWYEEEQDGLDATRQLYVTLNDILTSGHRVDLVDHWSDSPVSNIQTLDVSFDEVEEKTFRLFEDHKFRLNKADV